MPLGAHPQGPSLCKTSKPNVSAPLIWLAAPIQAEAILKGFSFKLRIEPRGPISCLLLGAFAAPSRSCACILWKHIGHAHVLGLRAVCSVFRTAIDEWFSATFSDFGLRTDSFPPMFTPMDPAALNANSDASSCRMRPPRAHTAHSEFLCLLQCPCCAAPSY